MPDDRLLEAPNSKVKRNASSVLGSLVSMVFKPNPRPSASLIPTSSEVLRASSTHNCPTAPNLGSNAIVMRRMHPQGLQGSASEETGIEEQMMAIKWRRGEGQTMRQPGKLWKMRPMQFFQKESFPATASKIREELSLYLKAVRAEYGRVVLTTLILKVIKAWQN